MSIGQENAQPPLSGPPSGLYGAPPASGPPPRQGTNGLSIAGFILAILLAPVGFVLSIIGLVQAGKRGQKGKGLAIAGIVISVIIMAGGTVAVAMAAKTVSKLADPGCTTGKAAILDNDSKIQNSATIKEGLQATIDGLKSATAKAKHDDVRAAMAALSADYQELLQDINTGTAPAQALSDKIGTDGKKVDSLCTIGAK